MKDYKRYTDYAVEQACRLLAIDSPTGYTGAAEEHLLETFRELGYAPVHTVKGGVLVDLGGKDAENGLLLAAHCDTLGAMVAEVKGSGRLRVLPLGGLPTVMVNTENCLILIEQLDGIADQIVKIHRVGGQQTLLIKLICLSDILQSAVVGRGGLDVLRLFHFIFVFRYFIQNRFMRQKLFVYIQLF